MIYTRRIAPRDSRGGTWGVLGGQQFKIWGSCQTAGPIDSCQTAGLIGIKFGIHVRIHLGMDMCMPNKLPLETKGGTWGVLGGQTLKSIGKLSNGWTDWHQLWFTYADSSGNGHIG